MFKYVGKQNFIVEQTHGRIPKQEGIGWLWTDYHENRNLYVRPVRHGQYQLVIFVNGTRTTDEVTTQTKIQSYTINNLGFHIHDNMFREMDKVVS